MRSTGYERREARNPGEASDANMTETGADPGAASVGTSYAAAKEEEADRREAHKAKRAAEQEAKASGADV